MNYYNIHRGTKEKDKIEVLLGKENAFIINRGLITMIRLPV
jgi:hypothetical protein